MAARGRRTALTFGRIMAAAAGGGVMADRARAASTVLTAARVRLLGAQHRVRAGTSSSRLLRRRALPVYRGWQRAGWQTVCLLNKTGRRAWAWAPYRRSYERAGRTACDASMFCAQHAAARSLLIAPPTTKPLSFYISPPPATPASVLHYLRLHLNAYATYCGSTCARLHLFWTRGLRNVDDMLPPSHAYRPTFSAAACPLPLRRFALHRGRGTPRARHTGLNNGSIRHLPLSRARRQHRA